VDASEWHYCFVATQLGGGMVTLLGDHVTPLGAHGHATAWPCHPAQGVLAPPITHYTPQRFKIAYGRGGSGTRGAAGCVWPVQAAATTAGSGAVPSTRQKAGPSAISANARRALPQGQATGAMASSWAMW